MFVTLHIEGDIKYFYFDNSLVDRLEILYREPSPFGLQQAYGVDSLMFPFLDARISPSNISEIRVAHTNFYTVITIEFDISHIDEEDLAVYFDPYTVDPFC